MPAASTQYFISIAHGLGGTPLGVWTNCRQGASWDYGKCWHGADTYTPTTFNFWVDWPAGPLAVATTFDWVAIA